ncbi:MAG TPA: HI0074 family nucleotidyltransferase substrate-binding subunit [Bacteroidales bacterium]|nr:HI0074 family nucleotidyltransferase substrate-binding subunit [Bacteroidales bacterium]HSA42087.1 HI0074 family nucleotidyltransferase substrate-binding subunit [Bacteroidales bacterium]
MNDLPRWKFRFENYCQALDSLTAFTDDPDALTELEKDGLIQRFEFTFELAWKCMQDYLLFTGYTGLRGPRHVIRQMARDMMIDAYPWFDMMQARNELSHIYDEKKSREYLQEILRSYIPLMEQFRRTMAAIYE